MKSRAKTIRVYDLACDQCGTTTRHEVEGGADRGTAIAEPFRASGDPDESRQWRTITLKPALGGGKHRHERIGFVCSDDCARAWAEANAVVVVSVETD